MRASWAIAPVAGILCTSLDSGIVECDTTNMMTMEEYLSLRLKALLFVMMDLTDEVSSGAIDMAKSNLEKMLRILS